MSFHLDSHHSGAYLCLIYWNIGEQGRYIKLNIISSDLKHTLLTVCMKCVEFFMYDCVLPNSGDIIFDMNFDKL